MKPAKDPVLAVLERGLKRIRMGWCRENMAQDKRGEPVSFESAKAVKWCVLGGTGTNIIGEWHAANAADALLAKALPKSANFALANWNDHPRRKKSDVIALYKRAIAARRKQVK